MLAYLSLSVLPAALLIAAANDLYEFKIPNWISITMICAYPVAGFAVSAPPQIMLEGFIIGAAALTLGFALFAARIIGGGDAKLLAATAPWLGAGGVGPFLLYTALAGLALTIAMVMFRKTPLLPIYTPCALDHQIARAQRGFALRRRYYRGRTY